MLSDFQKFVLRGNVVDLAVAVVEATSPAAPRRCAFCTSAVAAA